MKILHVLYAGLGGHGNVFFSLVHADKNHEHQYEALFNGVEPVRDEYKGRCNENRIPWKYVSKKPGLDLRYYQRLFNYINEASADVIFLHSSAYVLPARICTLLKRRKPLLIVRETQANHLKTKAEWFWLAIALVASDRIVFLSEDYRKQVKQKLSWFFNDSKVSVIPNGIDLERYKPATKIHRKKLTFGMQSRLVEIKDHRTLFAALKEIRDNYPEIQFSLLLAGEGSTRTPLENYSIELGLQNHIIFTGLLNEEALLDFMQSLDIYFHASLGETMSTAIMQAMACGLPIIASDVDGINNMIRDDETGLLVAVKDKVAMADKLLLLAKNEGVRERLGLHARLFAEEHFSNTKMYESYNSLFSGWNKH